LLQEEQPAGGHFPGAAHPRTRRSAVALKDNLPAQDRVFIGSLLTASSATSAT
jgi:hypothetical protein